MIVEDEQQGKERAAYGKAVLKNLSKRLAEKFGKGFSVDNLERMKKFFLIYSNQFSATPLRILQDTEGKSNTIRQRASGESSGITLSWSHYLVLMRIENPAERSFYEIEASSMFCCN